MAAGRKKHRERGLYEYKFNKRSGLWSGTKNLSALLGGHWRLEDGVALLTLLCLSGQQSGMGSDASPPAPKALSGPPISLHAPNTPMKQVFYRKQNVSPER